MAEDTKPYHGPLSPAHRIHRAARSFLGHQKQSNGKSIGQKIVKVLELDDIPKHFVVGVLADTLGELIAEVLERREMCDPYVVSLATMANGTLEAMIKDVEQV